MSEMTQTTSWVDSLDHLLFDCSIITGCLLNLLNEVSTFKTVHPHNHKVNGAARNYRLSVYAMSVFAKIQQQLDNGAYNKH
jgi:hypothetical protein